MTDLDLRRRGDVHVDAKPASTLDSLAFELGVVDAGTVTLLVDSRPGWSVTYSLNVEGPRLAGWRMGAADEMAPGGVDEFLWCRTILAAQCTTIHREGVKMSDKAGRDLTFASEDLQRILRIPANAPDGTTEAVRAFYANDFAIQAAADRVIAAAGFGKQAREDPTTGSSRV